MSTTDADQGTQPPVTTCYRHTGRESHVRCTRCDRYICPDCMREASVGHQCPECVREGNRGVREARTAFGGRIATSGVPTVTYALIALNVAMYVAEVLRPGIVVRLDGLGQGLLGPDGNGYVYHGGAVPPGYRAIGVAHGEWYRLLTSSVLHAGPLEGHFGITHILFNMAALWNIGRVVESQLGRVRYLGLYLLAALGGGVAEYVLAPYTPAVGASGAVFGLAAAYYVLSRRLRYDPLGGSQLIVTLLVWLVISAAVTSWQGHLGGLLTGGALGLALAYAPARHRAPVQAAGAVAVLAVLVVLVVVKTSQLTGAA
ncbi:rhomboid family intramembrane serine protease [Streptomyces sp. NPDC088354]|uniref:rhomboid family intramembrane serine protease n=1 Tax=unclassified Streptomyces TaxID=2593676 RepID=UPI0029BF28E3|nr:rhomboid family intramembrane serine protease [Streptomyces sp. MI02-7b]MDX3078184.1 rhomboid family intramembrane serine protease [Streptomyces sp. MI02-7b]